MFARVVRELIQRPRRLELVRVDVHADARRGFHDNAPFLAVTQCELAVVESWAFGRPYVVCVVEEALPVVCDDLAG